MVKCDLCKKEIAGNERLKKLRDHIYCIKCYRIVRKKAKKLFRR